MGVCRLWWFQIVLSFLGFIALLNVFEVFLLFCCFVIELDDLLKSSLFHFSCNTECVACWKVLCTFQVLERASNHPFLCKKCLRD